MNWDLNGLVPIGPGDRERLEALAAVHALPDCECSFANLLLWRDVYGERVLWANGRAVVVETVNGGVHFPIGPYLEPPELRRLSEALRQAGFSGDFYSVPEAYCEMFSDVAAYFEPVADEDAFDYLYRLTDLAEMSGARLRKKRNLVRQFERNYPDFTVEPVDRGRLPEVCRLADELNAGLAQSPFLAEEKMAMAAMDTWFEAAGLGGLILSAGGRPVGFSIFSPLPGGVWDIHFEKADHRVKGAPQKLVVAVAAELLARGGVMMNREQDMGEPGLRQAKHSLDPAAMYRRMLLKVKI
ncbi:MAG: DUF2156 domain-containing protein [Lentisphaeria bacterium]|nr:DUF2156 domain-containing protein [Lentisphaeria bacterium]